jgi:hypothetical protein
MDTVNVSSQFVLLYYQSSNTLCRETQLIHFQSHKGTLQKPFHYVPAHSSPQLYHFHVVLSILWQIPLLLCSLCIEVFVALVTLICTYFH